MASPHNYSTLEIPARECCLEWILPGRSKVWFSRLVVRPIEMMIQRYGGNGRQAAPTSRFGDPRDRRRPERATVHVDVAPLSEDFPGVARRLPSSRTSGRGRSSSTSYRSAWIVACANRYDLRRTDLRRPRLRLGTRDRRPWYGYRCKSISLDRWINSGAGGSGEDVGVGHHNWLRRIGGPRRPYSTHRGRLWLGIR